MYVFIILILQQQIATVSVSDYHFVLIQRSSENNLLLAIINFEGQSWTWDVEWCPRLVFSEIRWILIVTECER